MQCFLLAHYGHLGYRSLRYCSQQVRREENVVAPFTWPNNARVAFVLGIAFEVWDRTKPSTGRALQGGSIPANAVCRRDYSTETFRDFGAKIGLRRLLDICDKYDVKVSMPI